MCSKDGCQSPSRALGLCSGHYSAFRDARNREAGKPKIDYRAINKMEWTEEELEGLWQFVKKELKIV
jgi:murein endopeptidase